MTNKLNKIVYGAGIAAIYVVLTLVFAPISFGAIQFRVSEILCILPVFTVAGVPGLFIGCFIANLLGGAAIIDVIFGSLATLIGAYGTYLLRKNVKLAWLPPVISNTFIIPFVLRFAYGMPDMIPFLMLTVGIGEILTVGIAGNALRISLERYKDIIFRKAWDS